MKTRLRVLKLLIIFLGSTVATAAVFGQTTYTWTNQAGGDIATAVNWDPNGVPSPFNVGDTMQWDGRTTGDLSLTATNITIGGGNGVGLTIHLTANQVGAVNIHSTISISPGTRIKGIIIDSGAGAFSLGDTTLNAQDFIMGGTAGQVHGLVNNSTNAVTIYPNQMWINGGGGTHTFVFDGTGNWNITNYLITANSCPTLIVKSGSGTMTWTGANVPNSVGNSAIVSPLTINGGTLILKSTDLLGTQNITNNGMLLEYDAPAGA